MIPHTRRHTHTHTHTHTHSLNTFVEHEYERPHKRNAEGNVCPVHDAS